MCAAERGYAASHSAFSSARVSMKVVDIALARTRVTCARKRQPHKSCTIFLKKNSTRLYFLSDAFVFFRRPPSPSLSEDDERERERERERDLELRFFFSFLPPPFFRQLPSE